MKRVKKKKVNNKLIIIIKIMAMATFDFNLDRKAIYFLIGGAGVAVLGSVVYGIYNKKKSAKEVKTFPFKTIKPAAQSVGLEDKRTVAVLGATGFVGSHLVEHFIQSGKHRVYMLGRRFNEQNVNPGADAIYQVDMLSYESLEKAFEGVDSVILSAIILPTVYTNADDLRRLNILGAQNVVNAAKNAGVKNLILISGINLTQEQTNNEARALISAFDHIETLFTRANRNDNMHACVLAFSQLYGVRSEWYESVMRGDISYFPLLDNRASFVPIELAAEAVVKAEQKLHEGDNLVAGNVLSITGAPSTVREFFTNPSLGVKIKHMPIRVLSMIASVNQFVARLTGFAPFGVLLCPAMTSLFQFDEEVYDPRIPQEALEISEVPPLNEGIPRMVGKFRTREDNRQR